MPTHDAHAADANTESFHYRRPGVDITLRGDAKRHGIVSLRRRESEVDLAREPYFVLNVYRFMCAGSLMAIARSEPFDLEGTASGITLAWRPTDAHPAKLRAEYTVGEAGTVDLKLTSETEAALKGYEVYLSSYFDFSLDPYIVLPERPGQGGTNGQKLLKVTDSPLIHGHYVVFPKDSRAAGLRFDGRWIDNETKKIIAHWVTGPFIERPIVMMARPGEYVVQMMDPRSTLGIGTTYSGSPDDNIVHHNALYLSFFGNDTEPGTRQVARVRQVVCEGEPSLERVTALYDTFIQEIG